MAVELRSLRITSDFDAGRYVSGMNQKVAADRAGTESSKAAGAAVDGLKIKVSSAVPLIERLSRSYVDGYGSAAKFNSELMKLARSQDTSATSVQHLELIYTGLQKRFGLVADASELAVRGYSRVAQAIDNVNSRLNAQGDSTAASAMAARAEQLRQQFDPAYVSAQRLSSELNDLAEAERLGVQLTGGYEQALEQLTVRHDAVAAAAKRQREEYARLAQEARQVQAAESAQAKINSTLGVGGGTGLRASDSASVFADQLGRMEEIARLRAQQQADQFADDLRQSFSRNVSGTSARDSASTFQAEFARLEQLNQLRAQQQGAAFSSDLNERLGVNGYGTSARGSAAAFEEAARAAEELDRKVALVRAQIDPLANAQNRLNGELAEYEALAARGAITTTELAQAQTVARQRYEAYASEMQRQQKSGVGGLPSYQLTNLMYQGTDVVQSLALGMPVMQVFLQQGPQIAQIFAANSLATKAFIASLGLTTLAIGGTVTAVGLGAKAFSDYLVSIKAVETAAAGLGRGTAGTAGQMEAAAEAGASAADISIKSARAMEAQFLRTGRIGSEHFEDLIGLSKNFAATIGIDASTSGEKLAEMFADPVQAAQQLYRQYGLIDASTADYVQRLVAQNRASEAQGVLLNALPRRLASAAEATTALGRAWDSVATSASNAWDWMGRAVDRAVSGPSTEERIQQLQRTLSLPRVRGREGLEAELNDLMEQTRRQQQLAAAQAREQADARLAAPALEIASGSAATAEIRRRRELADRSSSLTRGMSAGGLSDDQQQDLNRTLDATIRALNTLLPAHEKEQRLAEIDLRIATERNPLIRANLAADRERIQLAGEEVGSQEAANRIAAARNQVVRETIANSSAQADDMRAELDARRRLNDQVAAGTITSTDANRMLQEELALRPLIAAAAMAEGDEKARLNKVIGELRAGYAGLSEQEKRASALEYLSGQSERIEQLRVEQALIGANETVRARANARLDAEQEIRRRGIDTNSSIAQQIRDQSDAIAQMSRQVERQAEAWSKVQSAAETTIDSMVDGLLDGDIDGALESIAKDVTGMLAEIAIKNPLKNALLGSDYGTISDVGGLGGIFSRLFGGGQTDPGSIVSNALGRSVGNMSVNAASVVVNGSVVGSAMSALGVDRMFSAANGNATTAAGGDVQSQIWNFFAGKGLASHQIAGIMGNINAESAFNPLAVGDSGNALGLFQHNDRASALLAAIGGQGNLGNVGSQLDFAWNELNTSERATLQRLLASTDVRSATSAFAGFERPRGWSLSNPEGADNYVGRLKGAEAALERFGNTTTTATQGLGTLGTGFDKFGTALSSFQPTSGGSGGLFGSILSGLSSFGQSVFGSSAQFASAWQAGGVGLYSGGGYTGAGGVYEPRGIVHAGEVVWSQADVARHGGVSNVEAMRTGARMPGYASGGAVGVAALPYAANASRFVQREERMPSIQIINQTSTPITGEVQEGQDEGGRRQSRLIISDEMGAAAQQKGGGFQKAMSRQYGLRPRGIPR